ncbi:NADAR family protein [Aeromicrobium sp. 179-A 4D2 NHS]|uniref:NADAR family protein n=1 Tax=Aeromicrobium sp. 179-A 4D2 NHS TaxID=3142375 RepID=UPI00399FA5EB
MNATKPMFTGELGFLSNFDTTPFDMPLLGGVVKSGEHAFNALKTLDPTQRAHVLAAQSPRDAKARGRRVTLRPGWDDGYRVRAMQDTLVAKFKHPDLAAKLIATGDLHLVEFNHWHDRFWGECTCPKHVGQQGVNMLGELLMALRARLLG